MASAYKSVRRLEVRARPVREAEERRAAPRPSGRPRRRGRAPVGRGRWCRRHRRGAGPVRHGGWRSLAGRSRNASSSTTTIAGRGMPARDAASAVDVQPALGVLQAGFDALGLAPHQDGPGIRVAQHGPHPDQLVGQRLQPSTERRLLPVPASSPGSRARPGPRLARSPCPPSRGGSPRRVRRPARTTRSRADGAPRRARAARRAGAPGARRRTGGGSDTSRRRSSSGTRNRFRRSSASSIALPPLLAGDGIAQRPVQRAEDRGLRAGSSGPARAGAAGPLRRGSRRCSGRRPAKPAMKPATSSRPCIESPASWSAAIQPSVRPSSAATSCAVSPRPITSLRYAAASSGVKRRSPARISTSSPRARRRAKRQRRVGARGDHQVHAAAGRCSSRNAMPTWISWRVDQRGSRRAPARCRRAAR